MIHHHPSTILLLLIIFIFLNNNNHCIHALIPHSALETIDRGDIAILPNFVPTDQVSRWRSDAQQLHRDGHFIVDALAGYGKSSANFDPAKDRAVLPAYIPSKQIPGPFVSGTMGDGTGRKALSSLMTQVRHELAVGLDRPGIGVDAGDLNRRCE